MSKTTGNAAPKRVSSKRQPSFNLPQLPSVLTKPLGLEGWAKFEPVILASLATEEPMLLVGPHGSAKSFMLERLARALGMDYRFYNASLLNYDDLVGIPLPNEERTGLRYLTTPSAIWDAEIVFIDEINRTRPELQNKLFPIVHERRVQGIELQRLRYRWAAMNPPPPPEAADEEADVYIGAEPLDPALMDRFSFILEIPGWQDLTEQEKRSILRDQYAGEHSFAIPPADLVRFAREQYELLTARSPQAIEDYLIALLAALESQRIKVSARRATMLHRNIHAVHAARMALYHAAWPQMAYQAIDWSTSALLALTHSLPQVADGRGVDPAALLGAHRQAWEITRIDADNPWRRLLTISDPMERCLVAIEGADGMSDNDLSQIILDGLASRATAGERTALALGVYLALREKRSLLAVVYETLAQDLRGVLQPRTASDTPDDSKVRTRCRRARDLASQLRAESGNGAAQRNRYGANLLAGLIPDAYEDVAPATVLKTFNAVWDRVGPDTKNMERANGTN